MSTLQNESINGHYKNVKFMCAVVASPEPNFSIESMDLIFSNWLLMYFSDRKVEELVERMVKWQKVSSQDDKGFQKFMDNVQYKCNGILRYECVFGDGFVSTGGIETTKEFVG